MRAHRAALSITTLVSLSATLTAVVLARHATSLARRVTEPTFAEHVAPILYKNCAACHRPDGIGPFSVFDFDSVKARIDDIRDAVQVGQMPPWHAEGPHGVFRNDRRLSDADKETILAWIAAGAKPGDMSKLPPRPQFAKWSIGTPDVVLTMQEDYTVPASGTVEYQYFQIPTNFTDDQWVEALEIQPGAREVVHHVLVYASVPALATPAPAAGTATTGAPARPVLVRNAAQSRMPPEPPRTDTLHRSPRVLGTLIGTEVPGTNVIEFPKGTALRLPAGTVLTFQMHYTAHGHEMKDRTSIGFRFAKAVPDEQILAAAFINGSFTIPAGTKDVAVPAEIGVNEPVRVWGLMPHTHLRGTRWQYTLDKPDGTSEVILDVPHYDFNWQTYYMFAKPLEMPAGSKIRSMAWYDNSASNKSNPDASKDVKWGDQTWEEMQYTGILYSVPSQRPRPAGRP